MDIQAIEVELLSEDPVILEAPTEGTLRFSSPIVIDRGALHAIAVEPVSIETLQSGINLPSFFENAFYHVASPDGLEWAVETEPLFFNVRDEYDPDLLLDNQTGSQLYQSWGFIYLEQLSDESWRAFLLRQPANETSLGSLWSMTAPDVSGPWTMSEGPLLTGEPDGWDEEGMFMATVLKVDELYYLFYTSHPSSALGLAISNDGSHWERQLPFDYASPTALGDNTVFELDPSQEWHISPIWHSQSGWWMIYAPLVSLGAEEIYGPGEYHLAWSPDGVQWQTTDVLFEYPDTGAAQSLGTIFQYDEQNQGCWYVSMSIGEGGQCFLARLVEKLQE